MDIFSPLKSKLDRMNYAAIESLSVSSSVPFHTIKKIRTGETKNPGVITVQKLIFAIEQQEKLAA